MGRKRSVIINVGNRFGRLSVIREVEKQGYYRFFECLCDCGNTTIVSMSNLRKGTTQSCGCYHWEQNKAERPKMQSENHQYIHTRLYNIWVGMRKRCNSEKHRAFKWYGQRGICICNEWSRFLNFRNWALHNGYKEDLTIDRINVNGDYEPNNCRWITIQEQQKNRRK